MGCKVKSGDREAELLLYQDDVLRWHGNADEADCITLLLESAKELRAEIRAKNPTEVILLSPYLWTGKMTEEATELSVNIAFGKAATASVNAETAGNVWHGGVWIGQNPREGLQEWEVDLGAFYDVRNAMVRVGCQMGSDCTFYQYEIHTSADGKHWEKQAENRRTSWSNGVLDYFTAKSVRYVKVVFVSVDGRLAAGIQKFEIYRDYGVDNVREYALEGIIAENNDLMFDSNCLEYDLPKQESLTIRALAMDSEAKVTICKTEVLQPENHRITDVPPVTIKREECGGIAVIEVRTASGRGMRTYQIHF